MSNLIQSKKARGILWVTTVSLVSVAGYFIGWGAEDKYELTTLDTPSPEMKLEEQGRYDEAIQAVRSREGLHEADADSQVAQIYLDRAKKDPVNREEGHNRLRFISISPQLWLHGTPSSWKPRSRFCKEVQLLSKGTCEAIRHSQSRKVSNLGLKEFDVRSRPGAIRHPRGAAQPVALEK